MADPRFYEKQGPFTLGEIARLCAAELAPGARAECALVDVAPLETAGPDDLSFLDNRAYLSQFAKSRAGACLVQPDFAAQAPATMELLITPTPYRAFARVARAFYPLADPAPGIAPSAVVDANAILEPGVRIEAGAVIGARAEIGARSLIGPNVVIGEGVMIGEGGRIGANVSISHSLIGKRVIIYPGARIGQDGFGFAPDPGEHLRIPQLGRVIIGDDVEIGANTTVDRGAGPDTMIGDRCMIDNLVQIAHNVELGPGCVIAAQVGISGSTKLADYVFIGGQAGLTGHLKVGAGARIAAQSGVMRDIAPGAMVGGSPAVAIRDWHRQNVAVARLARTKETRK